jgi:hypothetical protein
VKFRGTDVDVECFASPHPLRSSDHDYPVVRSPGSRVLIYIYSSSREAIILNFEQHPLLHTATLQAAKMPKIVRLTMFKIPDKEMITEAIQMYNTLAKDAKKVR